jgi:hypothetical protein
MSPVHYLTAYEWLEREGSLWKAVVGFWVVAVFTWFLGVLPWRRHRKTQKQIADRLDTTTPGGLTDLVTAVNELIEERANEDHR